jgi:hypothetical protein
LALGPGKYDDLATYVRQKAKARGVVLIVVDGNKGGGFAVQTELGLVLPLPAMLRKIADDIEQSGEGNA